MRSGAPEPERVVLSPDARPSSRRRLVPRRATARRPRLGGVLTSAGGTAGRVRDRGPHAAPGRRGARGRGALARAGARRCRAWAVRAAHALDLPEPGTTDDRRARRACAESARLAAGARPRADALRGRRLVPRRAGCRGARPRRPSGLHGDGLPPELPSAWRDPPRRRATGSARARKRRAATGAALDALAGDARAPPPRTARGARRPRLFPRHRPAGAAPAEDAPRRARLSRPPARAAHGSRRSAARAGGRARDAVRSGLREGARVGVQRGLAAEVGVEDARPRLDPAGAHQVDQRRHRLPLVNRVGQDALEASAEPDRLDRLRVRNAVRPRVPLVEEDDLAVLELASEADRVGGNPRDPGDLVPRLRDRRRAVDSEHGPWPLLRCEAGDHPGLRRAGDGADDDRVEEDAELALLLGHLVRPAREAEAAQRVIGRARRDGVRLPAALDHRRERLLPAGPEADVEARRVEPDVGAHDPREQDVPDLFVSVVRPVDPVLLDEDAAEAEVRGDGGDLARVVRLDAADRDQGVAPRREGVGREVLELARLVAAVREPRVAVLALGPGLDPPAEVLGEPLERMDWRRAEEERDPIEALQAHEP